MVIVWLIIGIWIGLMFAIGMMVVIFRKDRPVGFLEEGLTKDGAHYFQIKMNKSGFEELKNRKYAKFTIVHKEEPK
jgi:hypothetical protein